MVRTTQADTENLRVRESPWGFMDTEAVWRLKLDPKQLELLMQDLDTFEVATIPAEEVPPGFEAAFPWRWRPTRGANCEFYRTPNFDWGDRRADGNHFAMMYDPVSQFLYVWNKDNF